MVGHGVSSAGSYLADPTSPIPSHYASIVTTSTVRVKYVFNFQKRLDTVHEADLPIYVSEFSVKNSHIERRARDFEDALTLYFRWDYVFTGIPTCPKFI